LKLLNLIYLNIKKYEELDFFDILNVPEDFGPDLHPHLDRYPHPDSHPDPLVRGTDPRIRIRVRIRIKMSQILNTVTGMFFEVVLKFNFASNLRLKDNR
jgi:hypothetical protein